MHSLKEYVANVEKVYGNGLNLYFFLQIHKVPARRH